MMEPTKNMFNLNFFYYLIYREMECFSKLMISLGYIIFWILATSPVLLLVLLVTFLICSCLSLAFIYVCWNKLMGIRNSFWMHMTRMNAVLYGGSVCAHSYTAELLELTLFAVKGTIFLCGVTLFVAGGLVLGAPAIFLVNHTSSFKEIPDIFLYSYGRELSEVKWSYYYDKLDEILRPYFTPSAASSEAAYVVNDAPASARPGLESGSSPGVGEKKVLKAPAKAEETIDDKLWWAALSVIVGSSICVALSWITK